MKETEITVQILNGLSVAQKILESSGYVQKEVFTLEDSYFSMLNNQQIRKSHYKDIIDKSIIVRTIKKQDKYCLLEHKNKEYNQHGDVVAEEKTKCKIDNPENAIIIFKRAGLNNFLNVVQKLYVYTNGEIEFALQDVKRLGLCLEIEESANMSSKTAEEKLNQLKAVANSLGLRLGSNYSCKKVEMLLEKL